MMLWTITKHELLDHISTLRFSAIALISLILLVVSVLVFSAGFANRMAEYPRRVEGIVDREGKVDLRIVPCNSGIVLRALPAALGFCSLGGEQDLPNEVSMAVHALYTIQRENSPGDIYGSASRLDWRFVVGVVLSFAAGLLTYKTISGERRDGTLTLVLSHSVSRATLLFGKYLAAILALTVVLLVSVLLGLIVLQLTGTIQLGADDWLKVVIFVVLSIVYLSIFVLIGLLCSVSVKSPVISAVLFLFLWVGFVLVIPNLGGLLAREAGTIATSREMNETAKAIYDRYALTLAMDADGVAAVKRARETAREQLLTQYLQSLCNDVERSEALTVISPASAYTYAAERIVGGGTFRLASFVQNAIRYREGLFQAILAADKYDPESQHRYVPWNCGSNSFSQRVIDPGSAKEFKDMFPSSGQGVSAALGYLLILALYNIILFAATFWRFARQDVAPMGGV